MNKYFNRNIWVIRPTRNVLQKIEAVIEAPDAFAWVIFTAAAANTLAYIVMYSNPVIRSDAWYFLDVFIRKALNGTLHLGDFFAKRGGLDHAEPLRKLILLIDMRYFDLDFRYEALAGWFAAMISLLFLRRLVFWHESVEHPFRGLRVWIWAALCVALVSLNSTDVWNWPLVTSAFTSYVLLFATLLGIWRWLSLGRPALLLISVLALDIAADDVAILANVACLISLGVIYWQNSALRRRVLTGSGMLISCLVIVRIGYSLIFTAPSGVYMALGTRLDHLWTDFLAGGWWQWWVVPLASSVSFILPLKHFSGNNARFLQILVASGLLLAHVGFWWRVLWRRPALTAPGFAATALMLVFYAFVAGIIYGRIPVFGNSYLEQPRYVLVYSFNIVSLLLICAACRWEVPTCPSFVRKLFVVLMTLLIAWQIPLSYLAWKIGPYIKIYQQKMTWQLGEMARHPDKVPKSCAPELVVCNYAPKKRAELIHILKSHQLNVFSPQFQRNTRLDPDTPPK